MIRFWIAAVLLLLPGAIRAEDYPTRPVTMVVAAAAGGPIDVLARILAEHRTGRRDHGNRIWRLLNLELWYRVCIDGETDSPVGAAVTSSSARS